MKLHALMIAVALAAAGTTFAQAPNGTAKAPTDVSATAGASHDSPAKMHRKIAKAKRMHAHHQASARHHEHEMHARAMHHEHMHADAHMRHHNTRAMGAGSAASATDPDTRGRESRMNSAYEDWQRRQGAR
jgi:uncharacterized protein HemX